MKRVVVGVSSLGANLVSLLQGLNPSVPESCFQTGGAACAPQKPVLQDSLPIGDHLTTPRCGYVHHGIYAGNGQVIHYGGFCRLLRCRPVEEVSFEDFAGGHEVAVKLHVTPAFSGVVVLRRARSRLGENDYHLLSNNCEHFTEWCISGTSRCLQITKWQALADAALRFAKRGPRACAAIAGTY